MSSLRSLDIACEYGTVEDFVNDPTRYIQDEPKYTGLLCLNFTHVPWENEDLKYNFFEKVDSMDFRFFCFSWIGPLPPVFSNLVEVKEMNKFSRAFMWHTRLLKIAQKLRLGRHVQYLEWLKNSIEYDSMQRFLIKKVD